MVTMTPEEIKQELAQIERDLGDQITIVWVIVDEHGQETGQRIFRGTFRLGAKTPRPPSIVRGD